MEFESRKATTELWHLAHNESQIQTEAESDQYLSHTPYLLWLCSSKYTSLKQQLHYLRMVPKQRPREDFKPDEYSILIEGVR